MDVSPPAAPHGRTLVSPVHTLMFKEHEDVNVSLEGDDEGVFSFFLQCLSKEFYFMLTLKSLLVFSVQL